MKGDNRDQIGTREENGNNQDSKDGFRCVLRGFEP